MIMEPDESENISKKRRENQKLMTKHTWKRAGDARYKLLSWNSKYYILENKTTTAVYLIQIQWFQRSGFYISESSLWPILNFRIGKNFSVDKSDENFSV